MRDEMKLRLSPPHFWARRSTIRWEASPPSPRGGPRTHVAGGIALGPTQQHHPHHLAVAHLRGDPQWCCPVLRGEDTGWGAESG